MGKSFHEAHEEREDEGRRGARRWRDRRILGKIRDCRQGGQEQRLLTSLNRPICQPVNGKDSRPPFSDLPLSERLGGCHLFFLTPLTNYFRMVESALPQGKQIFYQLSVVTCDNQVFYQSVIFLSVIQPKRGNNLRCVVN